MLFASDRQNLLEKLKCKLKNLRAASGGGGGGELPHCASRPLMEPDASGTLWFSDSYITFMSPRMAPFIVKGN